MHDSLGSHAPHLQETDWRRPMSVNAAWVVLLVVCCVFSGVAGWLLHGVWR